MEVLSDRTYRFAAAPQDLWASISDVDGYRGWWPWLRRFDARALAADDTWTCVVQPPVPYTLRFSIELHEVEAPTHLRASVSGDIVGTATIDIASLDGGATSEVHLVSHLAPGNRALQAVARVAQPVVRFGHDWVLDTAARQFATRALG